MLVAPVHEVLDVLDDLQHRAALVQWLRRHPRPIAVVDAVVPPLKDRLESVLELIDRGLPRLVLVAVVHRQVVGPRNTEKPNLRIRPRHPGVEEIPEELVPSCGRTC